MTHYEELGVAPEASVEEIRAAYLQLAKLLHPDIQQEERLRHLAECQMRRLNHVYQTLTDPERRRAYDRGLRETVALPVAALPGEIHRPGDWKGQAAVWGGAFALGGCLMIWVSLSYHAVPPPEGIRLPVEAAPAAAAGNRRRPPRAAPAPEAPPSREPRRVEMPTGAAQASPRVTVEAPPGTAVATILPVPRAATEAPKPTFAGAWYLTPRRDRGRVPGLYSPEYVEALIEQRDGRLQGRYRSRYLITDRAISPEVTFRFEGAGSEPEAAVPWTAAQGGRGELRLRLLTANTLEVVWVAAELGESLGLASGKAVLVRRLIP